jgi:hypothetical protein
MYKLIWTFGGEHGSAKHKVFRVDCPSDNGGGDNGGGDNGGGDNGGGDNGGGDNGGGDNGGGNNGGGDSGGDQAPVPVPVKSDLPVTG